MLAGARSASGPLDPHSLGPHHPPLALTWQSWGQRANALGPEPDVSAKHAVGSKDERLWHRQPECSCGLEINDELESRRLLYG